MVVLLIIIYVAFISLGLPDPILGSAWPVLQLELNAPLELAGYITMVIAGGTIISSLSSNKMVSKFGTGKVMVVSVLMTALALLGFSFTPNVWLMFLLAIPLGLGGGSVDAALNNFVALHYSARHMSWLHCFWGVGTTLGLAIMSTQLDVTGGWRQGYLIIGGIQLVLTVALFLTLPLWKQAKSPLQEISEETAYVSDRQAIKLPGIWLALTSFLFFCSVETTAGLWASSYLNSARGVEAEAAAAAATAFYGAITLGRLLCGFIAGKLSSTMLIRLGQIVCLVGALLIMLPLPSAVGILGIGVLGFGTAPIYPSMIHETPRRFGVENSQAVIGLQMASAYVGSTFVPPLFGQIAALTTVKLYPYFLALCVVGMFVSCELMQRRIKCRT